MTYNYVIIRRRVRFLVFVFIVLLILGGLSAFFIVETANIAQQLSGKGSFIGERLPSVAEWVSKIHDAIAETAEKHPFMFYGTDWVGFSHFMMVIACIGVLREPVRNIWVIQFALIGCILMIPMTLVIGAARDLPWFWQLFDCGIGAVGAILFFICYRYVRRLERSEVKKW